jgi:hypothetical protein
MTGTTSWSRREFPASTTVARRDGRWRTMDGSSRRSRATPDTSRIRRAERSTTTSSGRNTTTHPYTTSPDRTPRRSIPHPPPVLGSTILARRITPSFTTVLHRRRRTRWTKRCRRARLGRTIRSCRWRIHPRSLCRREISSRSGMTVHRRTTRARSRAPGWSSASSRA